MKLRDKLKRFRERAGEHFTILRCPECGEEIWGTGDIAMKVLVRSGQKESGKNATLIRLWNES